MKRSMRWSVYVMLLMNVSWMHSSSFAKMTEEMARDAAPSSVKVSADYMRYRGNAGDVEALGNVRAVDGDTTVTTDRFVGNVKTQEYMAPDTFTYVNPEGTFVGENLYYNGKESQASMQKMEGLLRDRYVVRGEDFTFTTKDNQSKAQLKRAMATTKHAMTKVVAPDYRIEGDEITVIPNDKIVVKEARFYIKNWHVMSMGTFTSSLKKQSGGTSSSPFQILPMPDYNHGDGIGLRGRFTHSLSKDAYVFFSYGWYSKIGFKPSIGVAYDKKWGGMTLSYSKEESTVNDDNVWIIKSPELSAYIYPVRVGKTPFKIGARASYGYWKEGAVTGTHAMGNVQLTHDAWKLSPKLHLNAYAGYRMDYYGFTKSTRHMPYWGAELEAQMSSKWQGRLSYSSYEPDHASPYAFDTHDMDRRMDLKLRYQMDARNGLGMSFTLDEENHKLKYWDVQYYRDLHSLDMTIEYRLKQKELRVRITAKDF